MTGTGEVIAIPSFPADAGKRSQSLMQVIWRLVLNHAELVAVAPLLLLADDGLAQRLACRHPAS